MCTLNCAHSIANRRNVITTVDMLYKHHYTMYTKLQKYCVYIELTFSLTVWIVVVVVVVVVVHSTRTGTVAVLTTSA